jgi:hypothetical protein
MATSDVLSMDGHNFISSNKSPETLGHNHNSRSSQELGFDIECSAIIVFHCCLYMQEFKIEHEGV